MLLCWLKKRICSKNGLDRSRKVSFTHPSLNFTRWPRSWRLHPSCMDGRPLTDEELEARSDRNRFSIWPSFGVLEVFRFFFPHQMTIPLNDFPPVLQDLTVTSTHKKTRKKDPEPRDVSGKARISRHEMSRKDPDDLARQLVEASASDLQRLASKRQTRAKGKIVIILI